MAPSPCPVLLYSSCPCIRSLFPIESIKQQCEHMYDSIYKSVYDWFYTDPIILYDSKCNIKSIRYSGNISVSTHLILRHLCQKNILGIVYWIVCEWRPFPTQGRLHVSDAVYNFVYDSMYNLICIQRVNCELPCAGNCTRNRTPIRTKNRTCRRPFSHPLLIAL
jgi:hypothetical protein